VTPADEDGGSTALAFPGQGIDRAAVIAALDAAADHPLAAVLGDVLGAVGARHWAEADFEDTRVTQPAVYVASLLSARAVLAPEQVRFVLGHSLGEISAAAFARVIGDEDGLRLVETRAALCHRVHAARPGAMAAVMGLELTEVEWLRRRTVAATGQVLDVAALNGRRQVVVSGDLEAVERMTSAVAAAEGLVARLPIGGCYHSPLLAGAADELAGALAALPLGDAAVPVLSTTDLVPRRAAADIAASLVRALVLPVRWQESLGWLRDAGVAWVWDSGPGETLQKLARRGGEVRFRAVVEAR